MTKRVVAIVLTGVLAALAAGCSQRHRIQVESDTCWNGRVNDDQYINDCGNTTYRVLGPLRCVEVSKNTETGYLRLRIDNHPWVETADRFGNVQACN